MAHWRENLRDIMAVRGISMREMSLSAGLSDTYVFGILTKGTSPSIDALDALARALNIPLASLISPILDVEAVPIIGIAGAGGQWQPVDDWDRGHHEDGERSLLSAVPIDISANSVGIFVSREMSGTEYNTGDILFGNKHTGDAIKHCIGKECIVLNESGDRLVCFVLKSQTRGRFDLRSRDPLAADSSGAKIAWAAPIQWIRRNR